MSISSTDRSFRGILLFWAPLALQWLMMAVEGPFLAAIIARMGDATPNLAAYGVAFAFAILVESPVIMLMSASTALVEDRTSYFRLRNFANLLNAASTALLLLVLVPPVFRTIMIGMIGLPADVADLVYVSLWLLLPWPAAIGYRRFLHGVLIRSGRTRLVAWGTALRLMAMAATAFALYVEGSLPGAWVGAIALSAAVCTEAVATRIMARGAIRELLRGGAHSAPVGPTAAPVEGADLRAGAADTADTVAAEAHAGTPGYREIARFYYPLALTSFIGLTVQPLLTFMMGRAPAPVESLAVFPVVHALSFLFRSLAFSYQEAAIALLGRRSEHAGALARFGGWLGAFSVGGMAVVAFTPLAMFWFDTLSGLPPDLSRLALLPARILVPLPALAVVFALQQAILVQGRHTRPISIATGLEVAVIGLTFGGLGWAGGVTGVNAAMYALVAGRLASSLYLAAPVRAILRGS